MNKSSRLKYISEIVCIFFQEAREKSDPSKARMAHAWISKKETILNR